ncbi:MAG: F0F1 ATP synthase subunit epsilon [Firmicutes bacterium]|nr:F0F1 ATP synthase subunit epsilon [Bacillota bacterium]
MASKFKLEIVTPERKFYDDDVDMVVVRGTEGKMGILKDHIPLVTPLAIGMIEIEDDGEKKIAAVSEGYVEVGEEKTTIISDTAEWPEEIDIKRAEQAKERAEKRLNKNTKNIDTMRAEIALRKAVTRIEVAKIRSGK